MADYARILAAVDAELGTSALTHYATQAADLAVESLSGDLFAVAIQDWILTVFEGTSAELLRDVTPGDPKWKAPRGWPASARAVTSKMRRLAPAFRKAGWSVEDLGRGGHDKQVRWRICVPPATETAREDARERPQRPHGGEDAGEAGDSGRDSAPSPSGPQSKPPRFQQPQPVCSGCGRSYNPPNPTGRCYDCRAAEGPKVTA
jgi:hypothetical protein